MFIERTNARFERVPMKMSVYLHFFSRSSRFFPFSHMSFFQYANNKNKSDESLAKEKKIGKKSSIRRLRNTHIYACRRDLSN